MSAVVREEEEENGKAAGKAKCSPEMELQRVTTGIHCGHSDPRVHHQSAENQSKQCVPERHFSARWTLLLLLLLEMQQFCDGNHHHHHQSYNNNGKWNT